jgi:hypothetical protein
MIIDHQILLEHIFAHALILYKHEIITFYQSMMDR